jgi:NADH:ubiquinone oxidoreductase subunit 5 (subunit L)/multisubunit Na+/H+ antiporter MnhA subunit
METTLRIIENFNKITGALNPLIESSILLPICLFLFCFISYLLFQFMQWVNTFFSENKSENADVAAPKNKERKTFAAVCSLLLAIGTLLLGIGTYRIAQESARTNDLKQQELELLRKNQ